MDKIIVLNDYNYMDIINKGVNILNNNGVLLVPTDTVYGLVCSASSLSGANKIYEMKDRATSKKLPVIVSSLEQLKELPIEWNEYIEKLAKRYWPGALTLAIGVKENNINWLNDRVEMAVRIPDNKYIIDLANKVGPLLMTSANRSGVDACHSVDSALESLVIEPDLVIDGGELNGLSSTLVNVNNMYPKVEREGFIKENEIKKVIEDE